MPHFCPYRATETEPINHANDEVGPKDVEELKNDQEGVEEVVAEKRLVDLHGIIIRVVEDPGGREGKEEEKS